MDSDSLKMAAAKRALDFIRPGMKLGLGTGSTAAKFVELLGARVAEGFQVVGVPTSEGTRALAERFGVPLTTLDEEPELDLTVDGADEVDAQLRLLKGGGGALLREKIVAAAADRFVVIADESKPVERLARGFAALQRGECELARTEAEAVRNGGFPPLYIDPIDFVGLYRQRAAEMQQTGAANATVS